MNNLSNKRFNFIDKEYNSFGEAVNDVLKEKELTQKWLVKQIIRPDQNFESLQQQMSRWVRGDNVSEGYQVRINNALDINIHQSGSGKWVVSRTTDDLYNDLETDEGKEVFKKIKKYLASNTEEESDNHTRRILLAFRDQLKSQRAETDSMIQILNFLIDD